MRIFIWKRNTGKARFSGGIFSNDIEESSAKCTRETRGSYFYQEAQTNNILDETTLRQGILCTTYRHPMKIRCYASRWYSKFISQKNLAFLDRPKPYNVSHYRQGRISANGLSRSSRIALPKLTRGADSLKFPFFCLWCRNGLKSGEKIVAT